MEVEADREIVLAAADPHPGAADVAEMVDAIEAMAADRQLQPALMDEAEAIGIAVMAAGDDRRALLVAVLDRHLAPALRR